MAPGPPLAARLYGGEATRTHLTPAYPQPLPHPRDEAVPGKATLEATCSLIWGMRRGPRQAPRLPDAP